MLKAMVQTGPIPRRVPTAIQPAALRVYSVGSSEEIQ